MAPLFFRFANPTAGAVCLSLVNPYGSGVVDRAKTMGKILAWVIVSAAVVAVFAAGIVAVAAIF